LREEFPSGLQLIFVEVLRDEGLFVCVVVPPLDARFVAVQDDSRYAQVQEDALGSPYAV
jgi:hypothetical protein